jgi:hypothetical protein
MFFLFLCGIMNIVTIFIPDFLPSFGSLGLAVSRVEDFLEIDQSETRIACGVHVCQCIGTKLAVFIILSQSINKHDRHRQFLFLIGRFLELFSSETALPNNRNLVGSIYERSSIKIAHFVLIR